MNCLKIRRRDALLAAVLFAAASGCFREDKKSGDDKSKQKVTAQAGDAVQADIATVATRRGLSDADLLAAAETFVPTGGRDDYLGLFGTGSSGRVAVFGMPSMRILKYAGVFTPEAWQGFAYDDESKRLLESSAREDVEYKFGDLGLPALTRKDGRPDGESAFLVDSANARVALFALDDYETKQIVVNPVFQGSFPALATTANGEYVLQTSAAPEVPGGTFVDDGELPQKLRGGVTFWRYERATAEHHGHIAVDSSFTVELPPYLQGGVVAGAGQSAGLVFVLGRCRSAISPFDDTSPCTSAKAPGVLHVLSWQDLASKHARAGKIEGHHTFTLTEATGAGALWQVELPDGSEQITLSRDGTTLAVTSRTGNAVTLLDATRRASGAPADEFGVPTQPLVEVQKARIDVGGPTTGAAFGARGRLLVTALAPGRLVTIDTAKAEVASTLELGYEPAGVFIPYDEAGDRYAVVINKRPHGRFVKVGPITGLNPQLIDISGAPKPLYDMAVAQANALYGVAFKSDLPKSVVRYKPGTDSRTGQVSPLRTVAGKEKVLRDGNRVHVFATLVRSHITPELVEVDEGDVVTFHITNLEQAQDQTHGFTIDTYNVHGSWEPGKTASVTFTANRPGVFPYYCTEFCSALHLEMEGYLLVKPKGWKPSNDDRAAAAGAGDESDKAAYEGKLRQIQETQAVIDQVVTWLKANGYENDERAKELVKDAIEQLEQTKGIQPKIDAAASAAKWSQARLWAEQYFMYQVKAADAGLRAKKILEEAGVTKQ